MFAALYIGTPMQSTDDEGTAAFCLQIPGSTLDLTRLLNAKKFRSRGNKEGALKAMRLLAHEGLGELEERHGRGTSKVLHSTCESFVQKLTFCVAIHIQKETSAR